MAPGSSSRITNSNRRLDLSRLLCCLSLRGSREAAPIRPALRSFDSVLVPGHHTLEPPKSPDLRPRHAIRKTVQRLVGRASLSLRPHHERNASGKRGGRWGTIEDGESGIVLDEKDTDDTYACRNSDPGFDFVQLLPVEISAQIFSFLDYRTLAHCEVVSRSWREAASSTHVWRPVFYHRYGRWPITPGVDWRDMFRVNSVLHARWQNREMTHRCLKGHSDSVYCVQFDSSKVITGSRDRTIRVWDLESGKCTKVMGQSREAIPFGVVSPEFHDASVLCLQFDKNILVTGSSDNTCIIWSLPDYTFVAKLFHHRAGVLDVCFDDKYIVSCSKDTTICVWDRTTYQLIHQLRGHKGPVNAVAIRGDEIVSASGDASVKLWDIRTGECKREFKGHQRGLACVQISEDSQFIISGGNDKDIKIWNAHSGQCIRTLQGHTDLVRTLYVDSRNRRIISGSYDTTVKVWNLDSGELILDVREYNTTWILAAKADHRRIVSASQDGQSLVIDFSSGLKDIELLDK